MPSNGREISIHVESDASHGQADGCLLEAVPMKSAEAHVRLSMMLC